MQSTFRSSDSNGPSRRELLLLAAGAFSATVAGAPAAAAQAASIVVPPATAAVLPFSISVPQTAIDDLRHRLDSTRYPERETVGDWTQGVPLDKARALIEYGGIGMTGGASKSAQTRFRISAHGSTGLVFTSSTRGPRRPTLCPSFLPTGGPARS